MHGLLTPKDAQVNLTEKDSFEVQHDYLRRQLSTSAYLTFHFIIFLMLHSRCSFGTWNCCMVV